MGKKPIFAGIVFCITGLISTGIWTIFALFVPMLFTGNNNGATSAVAFLYVLLPFAAAIASVSVLVAAIRNWKKTFIISASVIGLSWLPLITTLFTG